jgi:ribosomal protein S18 acetylase RimI-like enzyme
MKHVISEAAGAGRAVTLGVVKTNPALRLYERLGFQITHEDDRKFYIRCGLAAPLPATGAGTHARGKS